MGRWVEKNHDIRQARQESAGEQSLQDATVQWGLARLDELEQRFGITTPHVVARALGISTPLATTLVAIRQASRGNRS